MKIPWVIPNYQRQDFEAMKKVFNTKWLSMGPEVKKFENKVTSLLHIKYGIAVNSGTSALDVALKCVKIQQSDEVIIPALSYIATANAVVYNQGTPVFVDIDDTLNINPDLIEERITDKTKAIMNIDFGGNVADYTSLIRICKRHNLSLIVDGAQSFGSQYHDDMCCTQGMMNTTSFHAAKILTTIEGGMVFTKNKKLYCKAQMIRNQGQSDRFIHPFLGNNYRMMDINAAMGCSQINRFKKALHVRRELVKYYQEHLTNVFYPEELKHTINSYSIFTILTNNRDRLMTHLSNNRIETRIHYPLPINKQQIHYRDETYPKATEVSKRILSLPLYLGLTRGQQDYIITKVNEFTKDL